MRITFESIVLADFSDALARGVTCNGSIVFEAVDIVRATTKRVFNRGNQLVNLAFAVRREFDTIKECETFLLTHFSLLPKSGLCLIECGTHAGDVTEVYLAGAALVASPQGSYEGVSCTVAYQIVAPVATTDEPPGILLPDAVITRGTLALDEDDETKEVEFDTPFDNPPIVTAAVMKPTSGDNIWPTLRGITTNGFSVDFQAPIPASGYVLHWIAAEA